MHSKKEYPEELPAYSPQQALKKAEEEKDRLEAILAAIGDGISIQDREYRVLYQNEAHRKLVGDHAGEYCYQAYEHKDKACEGCPVALSFQDGGIHTVERSALTERGMVYADITSSPLRDPSGKIIAGIEIARDITARKRLEQEARENERALNSERERAEQERENVTKELQKLIDKVKNSQREWRDTFDNIQDPIYITDADYTIKRANQAFIDFLGKPFSEVLDQKSYDLLNGLGNSPLLCQHDSLRKTGLPVDVELTDLTRKRTLKVSHFPYALTDNTFGGAVSIIRDVTDEREKEMRLIMAERLGSLGQMAAGIAHEINNPLASILGCAEALHLRVKKGRYNEVLFDKYLLIVQEEVARCKNITTNMLSVSRSAASEKSALDLKALLQRTIELMGYQGRLKEVRVNTEFAGGLPPLQGNEGELRQVFIIVITNALDAMNDSGVLTIGTRQTGDAVSITINDTGPGIPPEQLVRVFEPFFTTKSEKGGTGLGLSIARKLVANHQGELTLSSEQGKGTTATITLPVGAG